MLGEQNTFVSADVALAASCAVYRPSPSRGARANRARGHHTVRAAPRHPVRVMLVPATSVLACALLLRAPHRFAAGRAHAVASAAASAVDVVVVGGGPAGLAAATDLASAGLSVTVVERRETASAFEMQRAYLYLLDRRGQQWTDRHDLTATVRERGVLNEGYTITRAWPDAKGAVEVKPMLAGEASAAAIWVPRATLLDVLASAAARAGAHLRYGT